MTDKKTYGPTYKTVIFFHIFLFILLVCFVCLKSKIHCYQFQSVSSTMDYPSDSLACVISIITMITMLTLFVVATRGIAR